MDGRPSPCCRPGQFWGSRGRAACAHRAVTSRANEPLTCGSHRAMVSPRYCVYLAHR